MIEKFSHLNENFVTKSLYNAEMLTFFPEFCLLITDESFWTAAVLVQFTSQWYPYSLMIGCAQTKWAVKNADWQQCTRWIE